MAEGESPGGAAGARTGSLPAPADAPRPWVESYPPGVPQSYAYPAVPLTRLLDDAAQDFPDTVATDLAGARTTYRQLLDASDRFAQALAVLGVRKGDRVALLLPTCPQHLVALYAVWRLGAVVTEHDPTASAALIGQQLNDAGCRVVVCLDRTYVTLAALKGRLRTVAHIVATSLEEAMPLRRRPGAWLRRRRARSPRIGPGEGVLRMADLIEQTAPAAMQAPIDPDDDLAALLYTGGRGGAGVMLTHRNLLANAFQVRLWLPDVQAGRETVLVALPLWRAYGLTTCAVQGVLSAATLLLLPDPAGRRVQRTVTRRKPTLLFGDPHVYEALAGPAGRAEPRLPSVRVCLSGDGELSEPVARAIERRTGGKLREGWGMTECSPVALLNPVYGRAKAGTAGLPVPDTVCVLAAPGDPSRLAPPGEHGELLVAGPQVMRGYWNRPAETAAALDGGWLRTGTLARADADGYVTILGNAATRRP